MKKRHHVIFAGTGRAGTTFIMTILTKLGLDTGYKAEDIEKNIDKNARAGLERNIRKPDAPYIVKSPHISHYINDVIDSSDIIIDHAFIPIRDIDAAAKSRVFVSKSARNKKSLIKRIFSSNRGYAGGMTRTSSPKKQKAILLRDLSHMLVSMANNFVPITFIHYPKLVKEPEYLFEKLRPILGEILYSDFEKVYNQTLIPENVHQFTEDDK
ncbi:MAG: hypothetical protein KAS71_10495 [Bacteroidales bacterium]|nr:hypothetical protein [Bacteroidales bacterium]